MSHPSFASNIYSMLCPVCIKDFVLIVELYEPDRLVICPHCKKKVKNEEPKK